MDSTRFPQAEEIPVQQLRIQRLARELSPSEHDAEDLTQEAWLAALRRRGSGIDHLGGWMRTVTVRLAGKLGVRGRSRREWELRAARSEAESSVLEMLERRSLREYLERQIDALHEPYREVLRLRYLEELTPEEIARRLQRSGGTVRSQVNRGLAQLRVRINGDLDGDRGLRGTVLLTWLARRSTQALFAGAAAVTLGAAFLLSTSQRPSTARAVELARADRVAQDERSSAPADLARARPGSRDAVGSAAFAAAGTAASSPSALDSRRIAVGGRVLDHTGAPVPHAEVWVDGAGDDDPTLAARADEHGVYRVAELSLDSWVGARRDGRHPSPRLCVASFLPRDVNRRDAEIDLVIPRKVPGKLVVQVIDAEGEPLVGAHVRVIPGNASQPFLGPDLELRREPAGYTGRTDSRGVFEAWKLGGRVSYVQVEADAHAPAFVKTRRSFLLPERVVVDLARPLALSGGLRFLDGTPARGARLTLEQDDGRAPRVALAEPDGSFAFAGLAAGRFRIRASTAGVQSLVHVGELAADAERLDLELALSSAWTVAGVVLGPEGAPLAGARVMLDEREGVTDRDGRFTFGAVVPPGAAGATVRVYRRAGDAVPAAWLGGCQPGDTALSLVAGEPRARVQGRLIGASADTRLCLRAPYLPAELALASGPGEFRSGSLQPGVYELVARSPEGGACVVRRFALPPDEALDLGELALPEAGSLRLVLDASRPLGERVPQLILRSELFMLRCVARFEPDESGTSGAGVLRVERLPPGTYDAFLTMAGFADVLETIEIRQGQTLVRELTLTEGLRRDFVFDLPTSGVSPWGGARAELPELWLTGPAGSRRVFSASQARADDREGPFLSLNLAPGTYTLVAEQGELQGQLTFSVDGPLVRPADHPLRLELR